ncbi:MAG: hypothetical protein AB8G99_01610 [Planctomycetaceae bacterium]
MSGGITKAAFVLSFGLVWTLHTLEDSQLLYKMMSGLRPKALVLMDRIIDVTLVSMVGRHGAVAILGAGSFVGAFLAYRRAANEEGQQAQAAV